MTEYSKLTDLVLTQSLAVLAAGLDLGLLCVVCTNDCSKPELAFLPEVNLKALRADIVPTPH